MTVLTRTDLALVFPRLKYPSGDPPLGICSIAANAKKHGFNVEIIDTTWNRSVPWAVDRIAELNPHYVGIYASTLMLPAAMLIGKFSSRFATVVAGGPHATIRPQDCTWADLVVQGEGENTILEILDGQWKGHDIIRGNDVDLSQIPGPDLSDLDLKKYTEHWHYLDAWFPSYAGTNLLATRGCPFDCQFCQPTLDKIFGKGVRYPDPTKIVEQMMFYKEKHGIEHFFFHDDTFTANRKWLYSFFDAFKEASHMIYWGCNSRVNTVNRQILHDLYRNHCVSIHFGIESGSQRVLDEVHNKKITLEQVKQTINDAHDEGIKAGGFFMIGAPTETREEIQATIDLACSLPLSEASFSIFVPLPGTHIYENLKKQGIYLSDNYMDYDYYNSQPFQHDIPLYELRKIQKKALYRFYWGHKQYILTHLHSVKGVKKLLNKMGRVK